MHSESEGFFKASVNFIYIAMRVLLQVLMVLGNDSLNNILFFSFRFLEFDRNKRFLKLSEGVYFRNSYHFKILKFKI